MTTMVLCGKLDAGHKGWIERVVCFFKKRMHNANNGKDTLVYDASDYFERKWAFTRQPCRSGTTSWGGGCGNGTAPLFAPGATGFAAAAGGAAAGEEGPLGEGHRRHRGQPPPPLPPPLTPAAATSEAFGRPQVSLCEEYQDPVDLVNKSTKYKRSAGSEGCLDDMYSTPYASMELGSALQFSLSPSPVRRPGAGGVATPLASLRGEALRHPLNSSPNGNDNGANSGNGGGSSNGANRHDVTAGSHCDNGLNNGCVGDQNTTGVDISNSCGSSSSSRSSKTRACATVNDDDDHDDDDDDVGLNGSTASTVTTAATTAVTASSSSSRSVPCLPHAHHRKPIAIPSVGSSAAVAAGGAASRFSQHLSHHHHQNHRREQPTRHRHHHEPPPPPPLHAVGGDDPDCALDQSRHYYRDQQLQQQQQLKMCEIDVDDDEDPSHLNRHEHDPALKVADREADNPDGNSAIRPDSRASPASGLVATEVSSAPSANLQSDDVDGDDSSLADPLGINGNLRSESHEAPKSRAAPPPLPPPVPAPRHPRQGTNYQNLPSSTSEPGRHGSTEQRADNRASTVRSRHRSPPLRAVAASTATNSTQQQQEERQQQERLANDHQLQLQQDPSRDNRPEEDYDSPWDLPRGGARAPHSAARGLPATLSQATLAGCGDAGSSSFASSLCSGDVLPVPPRLPAMHRSTSLTSSPAGSVASSASSCASSSASSSCASSASCAGELSVLSTPMDDSHSSVAALVGGCNQRLATDKLHRFRASYDGSNGRSQLLRPATAVFADRGSGGSASAAAAVAAAGGGGCPLGGGRGGGPTLASSTALRRQAWYHGAISRHDAETLLHGHREGTYLVRISESSKQDYSLSIRSVRGFMHMKIVNKPDGGFVLGQFSKPFESIPEMIHHYSINKLPIKGAEHMSLLYPLAA